MWRDLLLMPPLHVLLQFDHSPNADHVQFTERQKYSSLKTRQIELNIQTYTNYTDIIYKYIYYLHMFLYYL